MPLRHGITPFVAIVFAVIGLYLVVARHRSARVVAPWFLTCAVLYGAWTLLLVALRGEPIVDNRQVTYSLLITVLAFAGSGMVLVRDPMRHFVIGSRLGVVVAAVISIGLNWEGVFRFGMGGNSAPFALITAITMATALIPLANAPRWAPNSIVYAVIGALPIFASETRAVLVVVAVVLIVEGFVWLAAMPKRHRIAAMVLIVPIGIAALVIGPIHEMIARLFLPVFWYYAGYDAEWAGSISGDLRLSMWQGAVKAIVDSPIVGYGDDRMEFVRAYAPNLQDALGEFRHVHNAVLDELLSHGMVGLLLLLGTLGAAFVHLFRKNPEPAVRRNIAYVLVAISAYGMFHNPFLHETTISAIFIYIGVMIADTSKREQALRPKISSPPAIRPA